MWHFSLHINLFSTLWTLKVPGCAHLCVGKHYACFKTLCMNLTKILTPALRVLLGCLLHSLSEELAGYIYSVHRLSCHMLNWQGRENLSQNINPHISYLDIFETSPYCFYWNVMEMSLTPLCSFLTLWRFDCYVRRFVKICAVAMCV